MKHRQKVWFSGIALAGMLILLAAVPAMGQLPTDYFPRPIPLGVSISNTPSLPYIYAGTAGMRVRAYNNPAKKFILSNNHVLGSVGPTLCPDTAPVGTWSLQPGTLDIGNDPGKDPHYVAGIFVKAVALVTGSTARNLVDAAISATTTSYVSSEILGIGIPTVSYVAPAVGMAVTKSGRTTGVTNGTVSTVNMTVLVNYGSGCNVYRFVKQVEVTPGTFSSAGDSGSAILDNATKAPVGLLFAGSSTSTVGNDVLNVYRSLGVIVDGSTPIASDEEFMAQAGRAAKDPQQGRLEAIQERNQDRILTTPGVVGMGIGRDAGGFVFRVFVSKPTAAAAIPATVEGVRVVVVDSGEFRAR